MVGKRISEVDYASVEQWHNHGTWCDDKFSLVSRAQRALSLALIDRT